MRTKLLLVLMVLTMSSTILAQNVGDYQSAGPGPAAWNNAASWLVYSGGNWIAATNYPGQIAGNYDIEIQAGHTITNPNISNAVDGTLTINGTLYLSTNQNVYLSTNAVIVTQNLGEIYFEGQANLYLPANTSFTVYPEGLMPYAENCTASKRIYIGTFLLSTCNGNGQGNPFSFNELMAANGSIFSIITYANQDCTTVLFSPNYLGIAGSTPTFSWEIIDPDLNSIVSNDTTSNPLIVDFQSLPTGIYEINLTYTTIYNGSNTVSSTRKITYDSRIFSWNGTYWSPDGTDINPNTGLNWVPEIYSRTLIEEGVSYDTGIDYYALGLNALSSFSACNLEIGNNAIVNIAENTFIETEFNVINNGELTIQDRGSLVQKNNTATFTGTNNTVTRITRGKTPYDYVYWGSPVVDAMSLSLAATTYFDRFYRWNITGAQTGNWMPISQTPAAGNGFIARVKPSHVSPATTQLVFSGELNSGPIVVNANVFAGGNINTDSGKSVLLANPYPSAISGRTLLTTYSQIANLLFWTSITVYTGTGQYQYADYATFNLSGSTAPSSAVGTQISNFTPNGYIASGQGFFAQVTSPINIEFNNNMRTRGFDVSNDIDNFNSQFFRTADTQTPEATTETEKHRLWINLNNGKDAPRQMLVGYMEGASNGFDNQYDGTSFTTNEIDIYTILENKELAIQGRGLPFNDADIIPVGYRVTNAGTYSITLGETDGLFTEYKEVYIKDKTTNTFHNLKKGSYEFHAQTGMFNDRFEIHFKEQSKENNEIVSENNILIYGANGALNVNSYETNIQTIEVYDLLGKLIYTANEINDNQFVSTTIKTANPFLIARVTLTNNQVITKKIIIN